MIDLPLTADDRAAWDSLAATAGTANPFYDPAGVAAGMLLPEGGRPRLLLVRDGSGLLGALPITVQRRRGVAMYVENWDQRLRALGEPLIYDGAEEEFWRVALPALAGLPGHWLRLSALDAESASTRALFTVLKQTGGAHYVTRRYGRAVLHHGLSSEEHAAQHVRGKVLKEHRRLRARLADRGELRFDRLAPDADSEPWIDELFRLEETGWKGREGVAASADAATEACFRHLILAAQRADNLDFHRMSVGGQPIAMLANLEHGREAFQLKIAYDEAWASFSPGVLLEMAYLAYALDERGLARVDSCARAGHPMIDRIWPDRRQIVSLVVPHDRWSSRLLCRTQAAWRARRKPALNPAVEGSPA
ncbi:GNAT family N-acetyltransferase [Sphingomonas radiodurans]|uniref:GNAT family N-acetyltransferase n=1 Tax=Sphingomonas radiodurans TaxID=2890321 RepID=UPI001E5AB09D|nr:GNAT family N-acetyltransferase [Sphingomonas radiodurans]WBH17829.1 GNAT family N-acetyltransferase [Sphingomonas radiodurans]